MNRCVSARCGGRLTGRLCGQRELGRDQSEPDVRRLQRTEYARDSQQVSWLPVAAPSGPGSGRTRGGPSPLRVASRPPGRCGSFCRDGRRVSRRDSGRHKARGLPDAVAPPPPHSAGPGEVPSPAVRSGGGWARRWLGKHTGSGRSGTHATHRHTCARTGTHRFPQVHRGRTRLLGHQGRAPPPAPRDVPADAAWLRVAAAGRCLSLPSFP